MGGESELFRKGGAELYLVDGNESALLQRGEFVLLLVKHGRSRLAAVVAMVGDMQWPLGKDSLVRRLGDAGFSFSSLPARLSYALALESLDTAETLKLEVLFQEYSTYLRGDRDATLLAGEYWTRLARDVDADADQNPRLHRDAPRLDMSRTLLAVQKRGMDKASPRLAQRMQQARRMSAVEKLFARSIESGAISVLRHVKNANTCVQKDLLLASVDAVAKVVEAVETAGKTLWEGAQAAAADWVDSNVHQRGKHVAESLEGVDSLITSAWTLNKLGLRMLFQTIASMSSMRTASQSSSSTSDGSGYSSANSDLGLLPSISSNSPTAYTTGNSAHIHAASLSLSAQSNAARPAGNIVLPRDATSRGLRIAHEPTLRQSRQIPPLLPPHFTDHKMVPPELPSPPPRFHGASVTSEHLVGRDVKTALSLAPGGLAGPDFPSSHHVHQLPQGSQMQASDQSLAIERARPSPPR